MTKTTLSDFSLLKEHIVRTIAFSDSHSEILHSLKELFREEINSIRRFEKIGTIGQLLIILELRGVLSEDNVEPLKSIARKINSSELLMKINKYEETHVSREYENYYETEKANKSSSFETFQYTNSTESSMKKKKDRITMTVVEEIGSYWKDLARSLKIREHVIDDIDNNHRTFATKALKMMQKYDSMADKQKWFVTLCESLEKIHRRGLANSLQEIMMMNL